MTERISYRQRVRTFGLGGNRRNTVEIRTPWGLVVPVHRLIVGPFSDACVEAANTVRWRPRRCDGFAYRPIRNAASLSLHSWALAHDWFATPPGVEPPGGVWTPNDPVPPEFARCFERRGFYWGARFSRRRDVPHIEWPGGAPTGAAIPAAGPTSVPEEEDDLASMTIAPKSSPGGQYAIIGDNLVPIGSQDELSYYERTGLVKPGGPVVWPDAYFNALKLRLNVQDH